MVIFNSLNHIMEISRSLSNKERLRLIFLLKDKKPRTLREIYDVSREDIGLEHRETLYKYLESLVSVGILNRVESKSRVEYVLAYDVITFNLLELSNIETSNHE